MTRLRHTAGLSFVGGRWEPDFDLVLEPGRIDRCIVRAHVGHLCGYVRLPDEHPWINWDHGHGDVMVHGGVDYIGEAPWCGPGTWLGFDCGHSGDLSPGTLSEPRGVRETVSIWERSEQCPHRCTYFLGQRRRQDLGGHRYDAFEYAPRELAWSEHLVSSGYVRSHIFQVYRPLEYVRDELEKLALAAEAAAPHLFPRSTS